MLNRRVILAGAAAVAVCRTAAANTKPKIVMTGDMGRVGGRLWPLLSPDYEIVGIDKKRGEAQNLETPADWVGLMQGAVAVVHLAWRMADYDTPQAIMYNVAITEATLLCAHRSGVPRFIFSSSAWAAPELYGHRTGFEPALYAGSKLFVENLLQQFNLSTRMATCAIRLGQVTGTHDPNPPDPNFDGRIRMSDMDLRGLFQMALGPSVSGILGPFEAR